MLVEAARCLRADPSIRILIVGDGVIAALPNLMSVGLLPAKRLGSLLFAADLHVLPQDKAARSRFPSMLEPLMMTGRPTVVTAEPCSEFALWLGGTALRCQPGNGRALAVAIVEGLQLGENRDPERAAMLLATLEAAAILPVFEHCLLPPESVFAGSSRTENPGVLIHTAGPTALA